MAEAFVEERLGEVRAAVVAGGRLIEMHVARLFDGVQPGEVIGGRLAGRMVAGHRVVLESGEEAVLSGPAPGAEGARLPVEVVREAIPEVGRLRPALVRAARAGAEPRPAPGLAERLAQAGHRLREGTFPAALEEQWDAGWAQAQAGQVAIADGLLILSPTPALLAIDIDGAPDPALAASAVAEIIRRFGIGGSIAVDFPGTGGRGWRQAAASAFDAAMAGLPFERTAVNGFGLLHIVRPRPRRSILDRARFEQDVTAALSLLEAARRETRAGPLVLTARAGVVALLERRRELIDQLARATGRTIALRCDGAAGDGHVSTS
ncbi:MAG: ribonuclease [Sphingomonadaceae bacterium]